MSGFDRKMKREAKKAQYGRFAKQWGNERAYQKYVTETLKQELPEGTPKLGRRPTFKMWTKMMEDMEKKTKTFVPETEVELETDLSWDEEEKATEAK